MIIEIVVGVLLVGLFLLILGGNVAIHDSLQENMGKIVYMNGITLKLLAEIAEPRKNKLPLKEIIKAVENKHGCVACFDAGGICDECNKKVRTVMEELN
tara:strand:- start:332 stop:628 length:297 start_codon:yes stop_codon:yes gene_type:complete